MNWKKSYEQWKNFPSLDPLLKQELTTLAYNDEKVKEAFFAPLEFGTAGMRGILGPGINRMNIYTVRQATEGLALFMEQKGKKAKQQGVVIAYDSRHFSQLFAIEAAKVLAKHHIKSYVFEQLRPTPELSFAVRYLHAFSGIMITASHNPSIYNGYKIYGKDGAQLPPVDADVLTSFVRQIENPLTIEVITEKEGVEKGYIKRIGKTIDQAYLDEVKQVTVNQKRVQKMGSSLSIVYTSLHGTGQMLAMRALQQVGFTNVHLVKEQGIPDGNFSTVVSPNPEEASAFEYAIALGKEKKADLLIATDPDADRLGAAVCLPNGTYQILTGNQLAALLIHYLVTAKKETNTLNKESVLITSIVSSTLPKAIASSYDIKTQEVLTGFKFIAQKIEEYEKTKTHHFLFGFEESYGYLIQPFVRDKDAIQTLVLLSEVAAFYKEKGQSLYDGLQEIFSMYGYYQEKTISVTFKGIEGQKKMKEVMEKLRQTPPLCFGNEKVLFYEDFKKGQRYNKKTKEQTPLSLPKADVLKYYLEQSAWIAVRPSGTEPKIKFYIGVKEDALEKAKEKIKQLEQSVRQLSD